MNIYNVFKSIIFSFPVQLRCKKGNISKYWFQLSSQVILYFLATPELRDVLRYDPQRQPELWRFVTYMFLHDSRVHLSLNVVVQCLFAMTLEKDQGNLRVLVVYLGGGMLGALGASALNPDLVVGASAGVYALLISHVSHIILVRSEPRPGCCSSFFTVVICFLCLQLLFLAWFSEFVDNEAQNLLHDDHSDHSDVGHHLQRLPRPVIQRSYHINRGPCCRCHRRIFSGTHPVQNRGQIEGESLDLFRIFHAVLGLRCTPAHQLSGEEVYEESLFDFLHLFLLTDRNFVLKKGGEGEEATIKILRYCVYLRKLLTDLWHLLG